ncbi:DUF982 domain-containing protein [Rhizobium tubonense]|uniref:DUF982 domain-containing protein n=1 Tax=Rhizobium tubonense TaxID=484088 RepID=A0A2W4CVP3_9HYPH|nr:DUF982 domain-containing protein [Rhizobium tubonense]PZM15581.1 hypothetical protein CPY51_07080 [Rhizobium tubonense]
MALVTDKIWSDGVYMELGKHGEYRVVGSTREAQDILLYRWPAQGGDAFRYALETCASVLNDQLPPDEARHALVLAAEEAGIFVADRFPRHMTLILPDPGGKKTDMKPRPKKRSQRIYRRP